MVEVWKALNRPLFYTTTLKREITHAWLVMLLSGGLGFMLGLIAGEPPQ